MNPGIYYDMSADVYFGDPCPTPSLTQSLAKILIEQSPLHAKLAHPKLTPRDPDDFEYDRVRAIGNAAHVVMTGRGKRLTVIHHEDFRSKAAKDERDRALANGCEPILKKHSGAATALVIAAHDQLQRIEGCQDAFRPTTGSGEVVAICLDDGLWLRTMIDWLSTDLREVWDLKTTVGTASPYAMGRKMAADGWIIQAAMHERILDTLDPENAGRRKFRYVCIEQDPPYALTVNEIGEAALTIGRKQLQYAIDAWRRCLDTNTWPAYPLRIIRPELPGWAETGWLNREVAEYEAEQELAPRAKMLTDLAGG